MGRYVTCKICGHRMNKLDANTYYCKWCSSKEDIEEAMEESDDSERINVYDAALIWASNGMDEDYMFGYTWEELENALK